MTVQDEEGLEQQVIKLKKKLFVSEEKNEALEHELQLLRQIKSDLQHILIDDVDEIRFTDTLALGKPLIISSLSNSSHFVQRLMKKKNVFCSTNSNKNYTTSNPGTKPTPPNSVLAASANSWKFKNRKTCYSFYS